MSQNTKEVDNYFKKLNKDVDHSLNNSRNSVWKYMITFNVIYAILYGLCRYVVQVDYSSFDMTVIEDKLQRFQSADVCLNFDESVSTNNKNKITKMFQKMNVPQDKSLYDEESKHLQFHINQKVGGCFKIDISHDEDLQNSGQIQIISDNQIKLIVQKGANKHIQQEISNVAQYLGYAPFGLKYFKPELITKNKFQTVQVTLFYAGGGETNDKLGQGALEMIQHQFKKLCVYKLGMVSADQIILRERYISEKSSDIVSSQTLNSQILIDAEKLNNYLSDEGALNQYNLEDTQISLTKYNTKSEHLNVAFFIQQRNGKNFAISDKLMNTYTSWSKVSQNQYASTLSIDSDVESTIQKVISDALRGSLHIPSSADLASASLSNGVGITDLRILEEVSDIKTYLKNQIRLENIETLKDFKAIINLLQINYLESSAPLYRGRNLHELARDVRDELTKYKIVTPISKETKVKMGVLYETKEMNPPYYFSIEFTLGTYGPIIAPFFITMCQVILKTLFKTEKKEKEEKEKEEKEKVE